jgi:hypothetical protein
MAGSHFERLSRIRLATPQRLACFRLSVGVIVVPASITLS